MRVLLTSGIYPPDIGGPATFIPKLAKQLEEQNHQVVIVTLGEQNSIKIEKNIKVLENSKFERDKKLIINAPSFVKLVTHPNVIQLNMIAPEILTHHSSDICSKPDGCVYTDLANAKPSLYYSVTVPKFTEYVSVYNCDEFNEKFC